MSRTQQDQFIDDEDEDLCPLCVEAFDLSDRSFRPCPCGYQICQFCYNNIKNNMNGLCPACRRPYDDKNIEWKKISPEEYKQDQANQAKKKQQAKQKEAQKREAESISRKHLQGIRVVQRNLVYVTGLTPTLREDQLLQTLRGEEYFGQYGKIIKIVVSKAKDTSHGQQSVGVYVTFAKREDAATCIASVNGSQNGERILRAQYGTTKYCSAYIRNEPCNNRNCMFLHEPGEESESFTRQDLSSRNVMTSTHATTSQINPSPATSAPPPQAAPQAVAAAQSGNRQDKEGTVSPTDSAGDGSALPSTASWGNKPAQGRRASRTTTASGASPRPTAATPAPPSEESTKAEAGMDDAEAASPAESTNHRRPLGPPSPPQFDFKELAESLRRLDKGRTNLSMFSPEDQKIIRNFPLLIDPNGGARRRRRLNKEAELRLKQEEEIQANAQSNAADAEAEMNAEGGSLQLGGEPEDRHVGMGQQLQAIQPPSAPHGLGQLGDDLSGLNGRGLTPQQQQQLLLQQLKGTSPSNMLNALSNHQSQQPPSGHPPGHARQTSRYSFANDSASTSIKPVANAKLMNQQSSMMPQGQSQYNPTQQHPLGGQFYSGVQGPPPGLKTTGTPPVNGVNMFGQGHGFASGGLGYGAGAAGRNANDEMVRNLLQRRNEIGGGQMQDAGKREFFPSFLQHHPPSSTASSSPAPGLLGGFPYGGPGQPGSMGMGPHFTGHQDSGAVSSSQKQQKKKGKKHRHANTSSSGGGGGSVVEDPSIVQARLHQSGAAGLMGQGLYAGQGQGGFPSMYNGGFSRW